MTGPQLTSCSYTVVESWKIFLYDQEQDNDAHTFINQGLKDLYTENYDFNERSWRETNREIFCAHGLEKNNILKMSILLKAVYRFSAIAIKILMVFFM